MTYTQDRRRQDDSDEEEAFGEEHWRPDGVILAGEPDFRELYRADSLQERIRRGMGNSYLYEGDGRWRTI